MVSPTGASRKRATCSWKWMRVGVQVDGCDGTGDEPGLVRRLVHPRTAEEAGAFDDVERAELGREYVDDVESRRAHVRARDVDCVRRDAAVVEAPGDGLDLREHVVALERGDLGHIATLYGRVEERRPPRTLLGRVVERVPVERADLGR